MNVTHTHDVSSEFLASLEDYRGWLLEESSDSEMTYTGVQRNFTGFVSQGSAQRLFNSTFNNPDPEAGGRITLFLERVDGALVFGRVCRPDEEDRFPNARVILSVHEDTPERREQLINEHRAEIMRNNQAPSLESCASNTNVFANAKSKHMSHEQVANRARQAQGMSLAL